MTNLAKGLAIGCLLVTVACEQARRSNDPEDMATSSDEDLAMDVDLRGGDLRGADLRTTNDLVPVVVDLTGTSPDLTTTDLVTASPDMAPSNTVTWSATEGLPSADCAPWTILDTAAAAPAIASGLLTIATATEGEFMFYNHADTVLTTPTTLIIEARLRFVSGSASVTTRTAAAVGFRIGPNKKRNTLHIADGEIFLLTDASTKGPTTTVTTTDAQHTYRIEVVTATGAMTVFRDNVSTLTGTAFEVTDALTPTILFGDASGMALGTSEWTSVSHNAHTPISCP